MLQRKFLRRQLLITLCLNSSAIIAGYTVGWTSPVVPLLQDINQTPLAHVLSVSQASWTLTAVLIGVIIGTWLCGWVSNKIGRKRTMVAGGVINISGYMILTWANNFVMLMVGRTLSGFGMGLVVPSNLVYLGEVASANIRGVLMTSLGVSHSIGSLLVYCIGPFTSYQVIGYVAILICIIHLVGCFFLPESPLFYIIKDQEESAREVLEYVGRNEGNGEELTNIVKNVKLSKEMTWRDMVTDKSNRRGFMVILPLFFNQEWSGIATITFFSITIFKEAGSSVEPALASIIIGATNLVGTLLVPGVIDRVGRRILLIFSTCGCAISMFILGLYFFLNRYEYSIIDSIRWLPVVLMVLTSIFFTLGLNIVPNTLVGELFRPNVRSVCSSIVLSTGFTSGLIASIAFGYIFEYLGIHVIFWIFAGVNTLGFLFTFFIVPETKGLTLLQIEKMLGSEIIK